MVVFFGFIGFWIIYNFVYDIKGDDVKVLLFEEVYMFMIVRLVVLWFLNFLEIILDDCMNVEMFYFLRIVK